MTMTEKKEQIREAAKQSNIRWNADKIYLNYLLIDQDPLSQQSKPFFYLIANGIQYGQASLNGYRTTYYDFSLQGQLPLSKARDKATSKKIADFEKKVDELMQYLVNYRNPYPDEQTLGIIEETVTPGTQVSPGEVYVYENRFFTRAY